MTQKTISVAGLSNQLTGYLSLRAADPHVNPAKLLAYDLSEKTASGEVTLEQLESILVEICNREMNARGTRLATRSGLNEVSKWQNHVRKEIKAQAANGFISFRRWVESEAIGLVVTAHPTFAMPREARQEIVASASENEKPRKLKAEKLLRTSPPTLLEEHEEAQLCISQMHAAIDTLNAMILTHAQKSFAKDWHKLTPHMVTVASWVGYDLDGRRDIQWSDTIRLKLNEKAVQLTRYYETAVEIAEDMGRKVSPALTKFIAEAEAAQSLALEEQAAFADNLDDKTKLVAAANLLSTNDRRRWTTAAPGMALLQKAIGETTNKKIQIRLATLRATMKRCGMGTAALHLRVNAQQVLSAMNAHVSITPGDRLDSRTLLKRVSRFAEQAKAVSTNFADLDIESSTVNRQLILAAQIIKHIDADMPIRFLIAECDQASIVLSALALARHYGVAERLDISPLFETSKALRNGGRVVAQMLEQDAYRAHVKMRGVIAIQTGFSDAGRFMGQVPAVLAIERLQSHLAAAISESGLENVRAVIFNTHGESAGRGGHPGTLTQRMDYIMSPWVFNRFAERNIQLTHEFSFQGGDGYLWFANYQLAEAGLMQLFSARFKDRSAAEKDPFYKDADFIWDFYNEVINQQDSLYNDGDYRFLLSGFARNYLLASGSRPEIRQASEPLSQSTFTPRRIRAIPHNALLQQLSVPTHIHFGLGRAGNIDPDRFRSVFSVSERGRTILGMVQDVWARTHLQIMAAYGDVQDPNFWISRALAHHDDADNWTYRVVAHNLYQRNSNARLRQLIYRLRADGEIFARLMGTINLPIALRLDVQDDNATHHQILCHAIRLAVMMHAQTQAATLPVNAPPGATRGEIMEKMCRHELGPVLQVLNETYPDQQDEGDWAQDLKEPGRDKQATQGVSRGTVATLEHCHRLVQLTSVGLMQSHNAYG